MKKVFIFLIAILYISSSCEATLYLHYCMGKPVSFSFLPEKSANCHRCGMKKGTKGMGCCKDEQKIIHTDKNQKLTDFLSYSGQQKKFIAVYSAYRPFITNAVYFRFFKHAAINGPPEPGPVSVYLMNCRLLI